MIRRRQTDSGSYFAAIVALAAIAIFVYIAYRVHWDEVKVHPETSCLLEGGYPGTAILIDATDPLSTSQGEMVEEKIRELFSEQLVKYEWVGIFVLRQDQKILPSVPRFFTCYPGNPDDANPIFENPREYERRYNEFFSKLNSVINEVICADKPEECSQDNSPILEMIYGVAKSDEFNQSERHRILIVSDMLHHTNEYSQYNSEVDFEHWLMSNRGKPFLEIDLLGGASVQILYILRPNAVDIQGHGKHIEFWELYFREIKSVVRRLITIYE